MECPRDKHLSDRLDKLESKLDLVLASLERIEADTRRNSDVACKYGEKADAVFGVVEGANRVLTMPLRRLGLDIGPRPKPREIKDSEKALQLDE